MSPVLEGNASKCPASGVSSTESVLVAEDSPVSRVLLKSWLEKWDFHVSLAEDGRQAWELLQRPDAPKLIIMDWMMPEMDGIELCQRVRALDASPRPYIVLLTARDKKQDLVLGFDSGADDYLTKPFDAEELRARLKAGMRILALQDALLRKEQELRFAAEHDALTGLWNRRAILDFLQRETERSSRTGEHSLVLMLDIDHFKSINDNYGHAVGDTVLQEVSRRLSASIRPYDWIGRYGGEEFLAIVTHCGPEMAFKYAERLRGAVAQEPVHTQTADIAVTISAGVALSGGGALADPQQVLLQADDALYNAKRNGRNRVEISWSAEAPADSLPIVANEESQRRPLSLPA